MAQKSGGIRRYEHLLLCVWNTHGRCCLLRFKSVGRPFSVTRLTQSKQDREQTAVARLMSKVNQSPECHGCGRRDALRRWDFGLGRPLGTETGETLASIAVSAATIPVLGIAGFRLPRKKTTLSVSRLQLLRCDA